MAIRVKLYGHFKLATPYERIIGVEQSWNSGAPISALLKSLDLPANVIVFVNGKQCSGYEEPIVADDEVLIFTPLAGG